jgi:hypothetical protein
VVVASGGPQPIKDSGSTPVHHLLGRNSELSETITRPSKQPSDHMDAATIQPAISALRVHPMSRTGGRRGQNRRSEE